MSKLDKVINDMNSARNSSMYLARHLDWNSARRSAWNSAWGLDVVYSTRRSARYSDKYKDNKNVEVFLRVLKDE